MDKNLTALREIEETLVEALALLASGKNDDLMAATRLIRRNVLNVQSLISIMNNRPDETNEV